MRRACLALLLIVLAPAAWGEEAVEEEDAPAREAWAAEKCRIYAAAWARAIDERGTAGLGEEFLLAQQRFLDSGCSGPREVCPRSPQELALADLLSVAAINEGMTGSFLPFACPGRP